MSRLPLVLAFGLSTLACSGEDPESGAVRDGWLVPFRSAFPDYVHTLASLETSGQTVVAEFTFSGTHQGPLLGFEPTGKRLDLPITGTYVISDEQVVDFDLEYDVQTVLAAIAP